MRRVQDTARWPRVHQAIVVLLQVAALFLIGQVGHQAVALLGLPLPGSVLGMVLLLALLSSGVVPLGWIERGAALLIRHLAFFFIPITVSLMGFADLFIAQGPAIVTTLMLSAAVGICVAGFCSQLLSDRRARRIE